MQDPVKTIGFYAKGCLAGGKADEQAGHQGGQKAGEHQNSPE